MNTTGAAANLGADDALPWASPTRLDATLLVGELERAHLAEVIHDDVLQMLGTGLLAAEMCEQAWRLGRNDLLPDQFAQLRSVLEQCVGRLRHLMADLRPYQPGAQGLDGALQPLFRAHLQRSRGAITFGQETQEALTGSGELLAYRLIVEALATLRDPSQPTDIRIELRSASSALELTTSFQPSHEDGANADMLAPKRVAILRWLVHTLGGTVNQASLSPAGTQLQLRVPVP